VFDELNLRTALGWPTVESPLLNEVRSIAQDTRRAAEVVLDRLTPPPVGPTPPL
jgi:hypothetical protein